MHEIISLNMGILETNTSAQHFEFSSVVKESGIRHDVQVAIFTPLSPELAVLKDSESLTILKNGTDFKLFPPISNILRFHVVDRGLRTVDRVTVTESFIEDKVVTESGEVISHFWNSPQALKRVRDLLKIYAPNPEINKQVVLFDILV